MTAGGGLTAACTHADFVTYHLHLPGKSAAWCPACGSFRGHDGVWMAPSRVPMGAGTAAKPERVTLGWIVNAWDERAQETIYLSSTFGGDSANERRRAAVFVTRARAEDAAISAVAADPKRWDNSTQIVRLVRKAAKP